MTDENNHCTVCNGTGEGQYEGWSCPACNGRGIQVDMTEQREREQYLAELKYEEMKYGY